MDKEQAVIHLKNNYTNIGHPIAYAGITQIFNYYNKIIPIHEIKNILSGFDTYTLHHEFHERKRNPSYSHFKRYQFQIDLVDIQNLADANDGVRFLLTCIDTFTRYAFVRMLKSKHAKVVINAFNSILIEAGTPPYSLVMDRGTEFQNQEFKKYCADRKIHYFPPDTSIHGAYVERFNRTLQSLIYKYMTENQTNRFIDKKNADNSVTKLMPLFMSTYNNRIHRMIGVSPHTAETDDSTHIEIVKKLDKYYSTIKKQPVTFRIGDIVRISKIKGKFNRGYHETAVREKFKIHEVKTNHRIPLYILSNLNGDEIIKGAFYASELIKVNE